MRFSRIMLAALAGFWVDLLLTAILVSLGFAVLGIEGPDQLHFQQPGHVVVGLLLPVAMTMIGGAVAGLLAAFDPQPAGALVGGLGLFWKVLEGVNPAEPHALTFIIAQCVATVLAALTATLVARRRRPV